MSRQRSARSTAAAAAVVAMFAIGAVGGCERGAPSVATTGTAQTSATSGGATTTNGEIPAAAWAAARNEAVGQILQQRVSAVDQGDRAGWLEALGSHPDARLAATQQRVFDRMTAMGARRMSIVALREQSEPLPTPAGTPVKWDVKANLSYELHGFDTSPRSFDLNLTFKADPAHPEAAVLTASTPSGRPQPWDLDGLVVRRTPHALVLAVGSRARVDEIVRRTATARARVAAVWGESQPAVWVAPATDADAARLLGRSAADLDGVAAATDGPLTPGQHAGADRIVLIPGAWTALQPDGRDVVMTHELTHATVRAATTQTVPLWLAEGFADYVAYRRIDLPEATIAAPALKQARDQGVPHALPTDADFDPSAGRLQTAYGLALLAVRTIADEYGTPDLVRLYEAAAGSISLPTAQVGDRDAALALAFEQTLHTRESTIVRDWQARIRGLLD
ncbi:hypothetical protein [Intrasporangium mesophilum]